MLTGGTYDEKHQETVKTLDTSSCSESTEKEQVSKRPWCRTLLAPFNIIIAHLFLEYLQFILKKIYVTFKLSNISATNPALLYSFVS
jgi:hypothetical protein